MDSLWEMKSRSENKGRLQFSGTIRKEGYVLFNDALNTVYLSEQSLLWQIFWNKEDKNKAELLKNNI